MYRGEVRSQFTTWVIPARKQGSGIDVLQFSSNFHHLLVFMKEAIPENFNSIPLFVLILRPFEVFMTRWLFPLLGISPFSGPNTHFHSLRETIDHFKFSLLMKSCSVFSMVGKN